MEATEPDVRDYLEGLSLRTIVPRVEARVLIGHGDTDPLIPSTESLRLADAVPDPSRVHGRHPQGGQPRGRPPLRSLHPRVPDDDSALLLPVLWVDLPDTEAAT